jgi:antirestriction protein ArdC
LERGPAGAYGPVATFKSWIDAGRCVRKGEKSRAFILQPRPFKRERETAAGEVVQEGGMAFGTLAMFTLDQTDGEALPKLTGEIDPSQDLPATFERLSQLAESLPCVSRVSVREGNVETGPRGWFDRSDGSIVVIRQDNVPAMVKTLVHEVAHAILHGETGHHDRAQNEVEAESAAFVVCHTIGLDTSEYSFPYVTSWAGEGGPAKAIVAAGDAITRASGVILDALFPSDEGAADVAEAAE